MSRGPAHALQAPTETRRGLSTPAPYDSCVFINCPFDASYRQLFRALVFTIQDCGFMPFSQLFLRGSA